VEAVVMQDLLATFSGRRVLITGDTGFKGSWLGLWLHELGADVLGYALPPERSDDHFVITGLGRIIRHVDGDIRDLSGLQRVFADFDPEIVFHLAAQPLVRLSYREPVETFATNVLGSTHVLEAVRTTESVRALVYVTSDKCYRNPEWVWGLREIDPLGGHDPYSASKAAAELVFSSYLDSFLSAREGFGGASVRAGNVIGGGDWADDRIVPDCIRALSSGEPIRLRNPGATRPWQHVLDPLAGYLVTAARLIAEPKHFSGSWNFGPTDDSIRTVRDVAHEITNAWGSGHVVEESDGSAVHEAASLHLNSDKARALLGWSSRWRFERAVEETVGWYRAILSGRSALEVSLAQLRAYVDGS
jgi:CDP-glucose 4,6-dehydratase